MEVGIKDIFLAEFMLRSVVKETPLTYSTTFSRMTGNNIFLKQENFQKNGSFKIRGAYNAIWSLSEEERKRGVVTFSAGNWSQGVAHACQLLGSKAVVVMPENCPLSKVSATKGYGAEVIQYGNNSNELWKRAIELQQERNLTFLNAFDNPMMIAGHASIALEILREKPDTDVIVTPIGGGGLASGIAMAAKSIKPDIKVIGVQPEGANAMYLSVKEGHVCEIPEVKTIADGLAVKKPGNGTFELVKRWVDEIVLVSDEEITEAILRLLERAKLVVEPAGAAPLAALLNGKIRLKNHEVVAVLSGGNIDLSRLGSIISATS